MTDTNVVMAVEHVSEVLRAIRDHVVPLLEAMKERQDRIIELLEDTNGLLRMEARARGDIE